MSTPYNQEIGNLVISQEQRNRLQQLFENGNKQMSLGAYDYATEMFAACVLGDPSNIIYLQSFLANLRKKFGEKKRKSMFSMLSSGGIRSAEMQKKWSSVLKSGLELLKSNPWNPSALFSIGKACLEMGYQDAGLAYLKHSIDANPNDIEVNRLAARVLGEAKKYDDAIACWARVKKLKPSDTEPDKLIGDLMVEKTIHRGGYEGAESSREVHAKGVADKNKGSQVPENEDVLGRILTFEEQIEKRLKKNPNDKSAYIELGDYYFQKNQFEEAANAFQRGLEKDPENHEMNGKLLESQKHRLQTELIKLKKEFEQSKTAEIRDQFNLKKTEYDQKCLELARFRVESEPGSIGNHFELATLLYKTGAYKEAISEYQLAKTDSLRTGEALLALGQCFQQIKQYKLAMLHFQEAVLNITDQGENKKKALYFAAKLSLGLKDYEKADDYANQLAAIDFSYKDVGELLDKIAKCRKTS